MDKLFNNNWFIKLISFFIAFMLFLMVNIDQFNNNQPGGVFPPGTNTTYTLEDVKVKVHYDEDRFEITEMTETVQVNLNGPQGAITLLQLTRPSYEVFVDLQGKEAGVHQVGIQHKGFPRELSVSVVPSFVRVVMQEKRTVSLPVEVDIVNKHKVADGYTIGEPIVTPITVEVTAAEDYINQLAIAKAYIDVVDANKTMEASTPVKLYDHFGNELNLPVEPSVVDVRVPITSPTKKVPIKITREGQLPQGVSISSLTLEPKDVIIYGPKNVIDQITVIENVILNQKEIEESQKVTLKIPIPEGVEKMEPDTVEVTLEVSKETAKVISDVSVEVSGLAEGNSLEILDFDGAVNITLIGAESVIEKVKKEEIQAILDISELSVGEHDVPVQVIGPQFLKFEPSITTVKIVIFDEE